MAKRTSKPRKPSHRSAQSLSRKEKKQILLLAQQLSREVPWLIYQHRDRIQTDAQWELSADVKKLRQLLNASRSERDYVAMGALVESLDTEAGNHFGKVRKSSQRRYIESMVVALIIAMFIRTFLFEPFKIPSGSMIPTLLVGDRLFVSKFIYGVNIPFTDVMLMDWRKPARGEVVVFTHPDPRPGGGDILIKRVMAVGGDRWRMVNNVWYINGEPLGEQRVLSRAHQCISQVGESCVYVTPNTDVAKKGCLCTHLEESDSGYTWITQHVEPGVECQCMTPIPEGEGKRLGYGINQSDWPQDGQEGVVPDGHVLVLGDNRDNSDDGRYWGTVPLHNIKGKAQFLWFATEDFWGRFLRKIH